MSQKRTEKTTTRSGGRAKIPKLNRGDIVIINWHDAFSAHENTWISAKEMKEFSGGPCSAFTVAMFWSIEIDQMNLMQTVMAGDGAIANPFSIPLGCIKKVAKIGELDLSNVYDD